ncbi:MAG: hypothetical protein COV74_00300 [Candidatus Omnitrophica bacterium CG11_big_fil_rev_8_21_14_0_20_45_26]|uniref:Isoprenylcysteine carboxyl methyltransferase n=1 Tax=Candidatus Abzuiibacterium crystallinum TaxID=1974748 RepID=A0A2H0LT63_9BACT|nr:MAG: hypothetical protein COV74_00300 [Candidatus Omnitrophica bacterium CG11_big_fil_rev_8_21_14_0_20_45_26]PIW64621.1 MAG: hypothetical protein COW12_05480 [Candidatus Omnitrophica bacterium CG12_big_fil_rev_8_21_14_0_65_45_16]
MSKKVTIINIFKLTGIVVVPIYTAMLYYFLPKTNTGLIFFCFVTICIIERAWETFNTSKERRREEVHGDWTLIAVTGAYLLVFFLFITEFYFLRFYSINIGVTFSGLVLLAASFRLRFWGMAALGKQWAVHAVGVQKIKKVRLVKIGPFKYVRHPIYLGIMMELTALPLIANAYYALIISLCLAVPLVVLRAFVEERTSFRRFGDRYLKYKKEVGMFFPWKLIKRGN